ncbi:HK97 family phage prohead protease [Streptomyces scabiei]|nr:HK97 family phage prohead protease [Streptomyces scabiei]MDX2892496.1 HK97 family phage prohead protease [Streptomyces scabiei]MDX2900589.1 HK97 family phage prohead protease [Streptomyces scabiei]MDX2994121.1 HK97 family phage prohead protease [Streptomyces scabiei]MDX3084763.1 HK97 family phage prohead protease [Streptomyces scabiei]MDX3137891.1 HK97 family phage prohead protease [Streptomyces scabiei]
MPVLSAVTRDLERSAPFQLVRADGDEEGDGRTLTGYAALFGQPTEINSWEGTFTETIRKGAFKKTIREQTPVMQFDHGRHPLIGSIPIGSIADLREDDQGLYVEGRITDNWLMQPVRDAIAEKSVNGMSFRFDVVREEWRDVNGKLVKPEEVYDLLWMPGDRGPLQRELIELKCRELGPVVFPAYAGTSVSVRARTVADGLALDDEMTRRIRHSLARDAAAPSVPDDPELRREVATALLYQRPGLPVLPSGQRPTQPAAPSAPGHPAPERSAGAPPTPGHPPTPSTTDAPPADGHPSPSERTARMRPQLAEIGGLMDDVLASIDTQKETG